MIAGYEAARVQVTVGDDDVALWRVADLERYVDRDALLRAEHPAEPPYWAHAWSGGHLLAEIVPARAGRVIEIGCGLGLPGIVAARRGADVVFVDQERAPLAFVRESLRANGCRARGLVVADFMRCAWGARFDVVLAAEVLYDRECFGRVADALADLVVPGGVVLLADGHRIDTARFYDEAARRGFTWYSSTRQVREEGLPVDVSLVVMQR